MGVENIVRLNAYVKHDSHLKDYMQPETSGWRGRHSVARRTPSFDADDRQRVARLEFKVEVEATAAK